MTTSPISPPGPSSDPAFLERLRDATDLLEIVADRALLLGVSPPTTGTASSRLPAKSFTRRQSPPPPGQGHDAGAQGRQVEA